MLTYIVVLMKEKTLYILEKLLNAFTHLADKFGIHWLVLFLLIIFVLYKYMKSKDDEINRMQEQIDSLANENRDYREIFLTRVVGLSEKELQKISPPKDNFGKKSSTKKNNPQ